MKKSENCDFKIFGPTIEMFKKRGRPRKYFSEEERINAKRMSRQRYTLNREWRCEYCNNFNYTLARKWNHLRTKKHIENVERKKLEEEIEEKIHEIKNLVEKKIEKKFNEKIDKIKKCISTHTNKND